MLYDEDAINRAYDLLKKANTYLQIASDYFGYNNVLNGNNLVKSCEKIIDECDEAIRKTEKIFDFTNLNSNNQTFNLSNIVSSNDDLEEIIDFSLYTKEEQEDIKEFIANNNTEGLIYYIFRKSALTEREKLQKQLDDIEEKLVEDFGREAGKAWTGSSLTKLTEEEKEQLKQEKNELSLRISQIDEEIYRYNLSIGLSKYNCYYEYSNNYKVKMDSSIENTLYTFVNNMGSLTEGIRSLKRENLEFDYIELLMYLYENPNELEKYLSLTGEEILIDDNFDKDLFIKLIEEKNILDLDSIVNSGSANFYNAFKFLSIEDLKLYCYLKEEKGNAVASDYLALKQDEINSKVGLAKAMEDFEWIANGGSITTVLKSYGVGIKDGVIQWGDNVSSFFSTSSTLSSNQYAISYLTSMLEGAYAFFEIDLDSLNEMKDSLGEDTYNSLKDSLENDCKITNLDLYYLTNQIDEDTYNNIKEITSTDEYQKYFNNKSDGFKYASKIAFQTGVSTGNMLPSVLISMLAQGMYLPTGISSNLSKIAMFLSSAGGSKKEALSQGNSLIRATIYGLLSGASEVTTEVLLGGIPGISQSKSWNIFNGSIKDSKVKTFLKILGRSLIEEPFKEMSEEAVQLPIGTLIESIALGKKIKLDESSAEWLEQLPETLLVAYFSSFGLNAASQTMNFLVNGRDITISSKQIESYFDENGEFNETKYNQDIMNLFNSALENNSTSTNTNTNNSNNTSGTGESTVKTNQLNTITSKLKKVFKSNPLYLNLLLRNMKSNNVDNNNQMILGFDEKVWNKKNIELLSQKIKEGVITTIPTTDVLMHDKKIFGDLMHYQPDFVKDNLYSFPIDMWSCSDYIKFHHDSDNKIDISFDYSREEFIKEAIEQGIYPAGLTTDDILNLTESEKQKFISMIKNNKANLDEILSSHDPKLIDFMISILEQKFLEKNSELIIKTLVSKKSVLNNLSYETRKVLLNFLIDKLSYNQIYNQDKFDYYKNFFDNFSDSDIENYVSKNIESILNMNLLSIIQDNILNNHIDEIYNNLRARWDIITSSKLKFNRQLLEKFLQSRDYADMGTAFHYFDKSIFTDEIIEKYADKIVKFISRYRTIPFNLYDNECLIKICLHSSNDLLKFFPPSFVIDHINELIELNKKDIVISVIESCYSSFDLNMLLQVNDDILEMCLSNNKMAMIKLFRNLNEDARKKFESMVKTIKLKGLDVSKIHFESVKDIEKLFSLITKIEFSNSLEIKKLGWELIPQLLLFDNPELVIDDVEKIFLRKDIPIVGKLYLTWEKLHPDFSGYNLKNSGLSPTLLSFFETGNLTGAQKVIFSDLLLSALGSNNRSLIEYINDIELGNEIFENLQSGNIKIEELSDKQQEVLKTFIYHLNALYNNSDNVRNSYVDKNVLTGNFETDLSRLSILFRINRELGENIPDKIVQMFAHDAGFDTIASLKEYMAKKVEETNTRNFKRAYEGTFTVEVGDLVKGLGDRLFDFTIFENILQNGSIAADYLGADSHTDATPLDTDLCKIFEIKGSVGETILNTSSVGYGTVFAVLKNDGRFQETRKYKFESNQELTKDVDLRKIESFQTGHLADNHYGIRTGFASSEIDFLVCGEEDLLRTGFEIARNGIYIPVVDYNGNLVFTPEDYTALRNKMSGLSHYNTGSYQFSPKLVPSEEISLAQKANREEVKTKQFAILKHFANAISSLGLNIKMAIDGDLVPGTIEIIDTGSTGRYTNKPHDADFDYMFRIDRSVRENINEFMALKKVLNEALSDRDDTSFITDKSDFRFKGVKIPGLEERVDIDITFTDRTDRIKYSSDMSLKDRLNTIKEQDPSRYDVVVNEIINAKKILKAGRCYKPVHSNAGQDGLGGVGVENWILQFGGSLEDAARSFIEVANSCSTFAEFCKKYQVWDFGENFVSKPKKDKYLQLITYLHDEFVSNNMSGDGYLKMQKVLSIYLKYVDMNVSNPIELTLEELNANEK